MSVDLPFTLAGRPTLYTLELAKEICDKLAYSGKGLATLCRENEHWPDRITIYRWMDERDGFRDMYEKAKNTRLDNMLSHMEDIIINAVDDIGQNGKEATSSIAMNLINKHVDLLKWQLTKLRPKQFGDKMTFETNGPTHEDFLKALVDKKNKDRQKTYKAKDAL